MSSFCTSHNIETTTVGGLPIARLDMKQTAVTMIDAARSKSQNERPFYFTSANGEVIACCHHDRQFTQLVTEADLISADGQPLIFASRLFAHNPLPERVATTDLFDVVAAEAEQRDISFYLFGATEDANRKAYERTRKAFPRLRILGRSHGYLTGAELDRKIAEIDFLGPDILWIAIGVPYEQQFARRFASELTHVGLIKTSGGLFDFLSGMKPRAPVWMQHAGLEWAYRLGREPRRLFRRYAVTNPIAAIELFRATQ